MALSLLTCMLPAMRHCWAVQCMRLGQLQQTAAATCSECCWLTATCSSLLSCHSCWQGVERVASVPSASLYCQLCFQVHPVPLSSASCFQDGNPPKAAVRSLDLGIRRGEVFGLLGPNGAGKTSAIHMMIGFLEPTAGAGGRVQGCRVWRRPQRESQGLLYGSHNDWLIGAHSRCLGVRVWCAPPESARVCHAP